MPRSRILEQQIAVFGESGSGKTVLLSSFYGATQEPQYLRDSLFHVVADDIGQGSRLHRNYLGMRDESRPPAANRFSATRYAFTIRWKEPGATRRAARPFDALRLVWHDYPGEWFEQGVSGPEEERRRLDTFRSLLGSDIALLLVDGQRLRDNAGEEERYLKSYFGNVRNSLLSLRDGLLEGGKPLVQFPRIWVLALSKADLLPDRDVFAFRDLLLAKAGDEIDALRDVLSGMVAGSEALAVGEDFLLLSSARFDPERIVVTERIGVELLLPLAAMVPFQRHVRWARAKQLPGKVAENLTAGAGLVASALIGRSQRVPAPIRLVMKLADVDLVSEAARLAGDALHRMNTEAREKHENLRATLTGFTLQLDEAEQQGTLLRSRR